VIETNPGVRLRPPSPLTDGRWVAENLLTRERFALALPGAMLLIACLKAQPRREAVAAVCGRLLLPEAQIDHLVDTLHAQGLLRGDDRDASNASGNNETMEWSRALRARWWARGWGHAAEYHLLTYDYPFLDYSSGDAVQTDLDMMARYGEADADVQRYTRYPEAPWLPGPAVSAALAPAPIADSWADAAPADALSTDTLLAILSLACGQTGEIRTAAPGAAPLLFRTSPSGGARHPTETYVLALRVDDLAPGWYHARVDQPGLEAVAPAPAAAELCGLRAALDAPPEFAPAAFVLLTTVFERNMYRYREPRTYRAVHLDAGHLAATLELLARAFGVAAVIGCCLADAAAEAQLSLDPLAEGPMLVLALGGHGS